MAIIDELRRQNSFGDAAAASLDRRVAQIPTEGMRAPAADGSQNNPLNTDLGRNVSNTLGALPGAAAVPGAAAAVGGLAARALGASTPAMTAVGRAAQTAAPYAPAAGGAAALHSAAGASSPAAPSMPASGLTSQVAAVPAPAQPVAASAATRPQGLADAAGVTPGSATMGNVTRVGNSYSGANIGGDITINGQAPRNGGQVSAQTMAAADGLAARALSQAPAMQQAPTSLAQAAGVTAPTVLHSGNSWQARNDLRNLEVSASSIMNRPGWEVAGMGRYARQQGTPAATQAYQAAQAADITARGAQSAYDMKAAQENAAIQREGMQQQGANQRSLAQAALEQQKINQSADEWGYTKRANSLVEALRQQVAAEQDPVKRHGIVQRLRDTQGQASAPRWKTSVVPGGVDANGQKLPGYGLLTDESTGEHRVIQPGQGGAQAQQTPLSNPSTRPVGTVSTVGGQSAVWDGSKWVPRG